jgi:hypothetical protein
MGLVHVCIARTPLVDLLASLSKERLVEVLSPGESTGNRDVLQCPATQYPWLSGQILHSRGIQV